MGTEKTGEDSKPVNIYGIGGTLGTVALTDQDLGILRKHADATAGGLVKWNSETIGIIRKILSGRINDALNETRDSDTVKITYDKIMYDSEKIQLITQTCSCRRGEPLHLGFTFDEAPNIDISLDLKEELIGVETNPSLLDIIQKTQISNINKITISCLGVGSNSFVCIEINKGDPSLTIFENAYLLTQCFKELQKNPEIFSQTTDAISAQFNEIWTKINSTALPS